MSPLLLPKWIRSLTWLIANQLLGRRPGPLVCPDCGATIPAPRLSEDALWDTRVDCRACGTTMSVMALGMGQRTPEEVAVQMSEDSVPVGKPQASRIEVRENDDARMWRVPAKGGCGSMLIFGVCWTAFSSFMALVFFLGASESGEGPLWFARAFVSFFVLIGLVLMYIGLRMTRSENWLLIRADTVAHERHFLGRAKRTTLSRSSISLVDLTVFYEENYKPVHGIEIRGAEGKIKFGSALEAEEKAWLVQDIRHTLSLTHEAAEESFEAGTAESTARPKIEIRESPGECTLISTQENAGMGAVPWAGVFFAAVALFMMAVGPVVSSSDGAPLIVEWFELGFALLWYGGLTVFLTIGVLMAVIGWRLRGIEQTIQVDHHGFHLRLKQGYRRVEKRWDCDEVEGLAVREITRSSTNGQLSKRGFRVEVTLPDRICGFGGGSSRSDLNQALTALRKVLPRVPSSPEGA